MAFKMILRLITLYGNEYGTYLTEGNSCRITKLVPRRLSYGISGPNDFGKWKMAEFISLLTSTCASFQVRGPNPKNYFEFYAGAAL